MSRLFAALLAALLSFSALAQDYAGTWAAKNPSGTVVMLTLRKEADGGYAGKLEGPTASFIVEAEVKPDGLFGMITGSDSMVYLMGDLAGDQLRVTLFEPGPTGEPIMQSARQILFSRN